MNKVFAENENRDIYLGLNNQIAINTGLFAVLQACKAAVEIQKGEALYHQENGIPNDLVIWGGTPNLPQFEFFARKQISNVTGVIDIEEFTIIQNNDILQYQAVIKTTHGTGDINGSV